MDSKSLAFTIFKSKQIYLNVCRNATYCSYLAVVLREKLPNLCSVNDRISACRGREKMGMNQKIFCRKHGWLSTYLFLQYNFHHGTYTLKVQGVENRECVIIFVHLFQPIIGTYPVRSCSTYYTSPLYLKFPISESFNFFPENFCCCLCLSPGSKMKSGPILITACHSQSTSA